VTRIVAKKLRPVPPEVVPPEVVPEAAPNFAFHLVSRILSVCGCCTISEEPLSRAKKATVTIGTEKGALGSGFFIPSSNGLRLITCLHVLNAALNRGAQLLHVGVGIVFDPKYLARIVAYDEMLDVAILEITQRLDGEKLKIMGGKLVHPPAEWELDVPPIPVVAEYLELAKKKAAAATKVAIVGYGSRRTRPNLARRITVGHVVEYEPPHSVHPRQRCELLLTDAEGLGGQSGGPLVDFKTEEMLGLFALSDTDKHYTFDLQGNISGHVKVSTGGLHAAVPANALVEFLTANGMLISCN